MWVPDFYAELWGSADVGIGLPAFSAGVTAAFTLVGLHIPVQFVANLDGVAPKALPAGTDERTARLQACGLASWTKPYISSLGGEIGFYVKWSDASPLFSIAGALS